MDTRIICTLVYVVVTELAVPALLALTLEVAGVYQTDTHVGVLRARAVPAEVHLLLAVQPGEGTVTLAMVAQDVIYTGSFMQAGNVLRYTLVNLSLALCSFKSSF